MKILSLICIAAGFLISVGLINYAGAVVYGGWFIFITAPVCISAGIHFFSVWEKL